MPSSINPKQIVFNYIKLKSLDKNPNTKFTAKFWKVQNCAKCLIMHGAKYINPSGQNIKQLLKMLNTRHSLLTSFSEWFGEWVTILINRRIINFFQFVSLYFNLYLKCSIKWKDKSHQSKCQKILCPSVYGTYKWIFSKERKTQLHQENDSIENIPDIYEHILGVSEMSSHGICQKHITNKCETTSIKFFWEGSCFENKKLTHNLTTKLMILIVIFVCLFSLDKK